MNKQGAKCLECGKEYTCFLFSENRGYNFEDYKCPSCESTNKESAQIILKSGVEGWSKVGDLV